MSLRVTLVLLSLFNLSTANLIDNIFSKSTNEVRPVYFKAYGKQGTPYIVKTETDIINFDAGHLRLRSHIQAQFIVSEVRYKWILPPGVELSWGEAEGVLSDLGQKDLPSLEIEVRGLNLSSNQNIILFLERRNGDQELGSSFVIASRKDLTEEFKKMPSVDVGQNELKKMSFEDSNFDESNIPTKKKFIY